MENEPKLWKRNQQILTKMKTLILINRMTKLSVSEPLDLLISSIDEAIVDAKDKLNVLESSGLDNAATELQKKILRWETARRLNR